MREHPLQRRIDACLEALRPAMAIDGGGVEVESVTDEHVTLRFVGACVFCPSQPLTLGRTIVPALREILPPGVAISVSSRG